MTPRRPRLTLIDLMAAIGAAALGLALIACAAPGQVAPTMMVIAPLVGILWGRRRGGRGILGGALGGLAHAAISLPFFVLGPLRAGVVDWPAKYAGATAVCVAFGAMMGVAAWLVAAAMGRPVGHAAPPEPG
jgi:hypothetical protein